MFALLKCSTHISFGGIDGRAFNQEVHRGFLIFGGSGYLLTGRIVCSYLDFNVPRTKSDSNQKFFTPDGSEELVRGSGGVGLQQLRSHQRHFWLDQALGNC